MSFQFERLKSGKVLFKNGANIKKVFNSSTYMYAKPATDGVIVFSENADQRVIEGQFEVEESSVSVPSHTDRNDLLRKLAERFFFAPPIKLADSPNLDAFGRLRVSEIQSLIDLKQINDELPNFFDTELIGAGASTHSVILARSRLAVTSGTDAVIRQTFQRLNYSSGKSQVIDLTFSNIEPQTDVIKRVGYFSSNTVTPFDSTRDGIYLESDGTNVNIVVERSGAEVEKVAQSSWNLDKLDGTGVSSLTADWTKEQILRIDFQWLGAGRVRFGLSINGVVVYFHEVLNANVNADVFISSPNQPIRYEIRSAGGSGTFDQICASAGSEGARNELAAIRSFDMGTTSINAALTVNKYMLLGMRLKATHINTAIRLVRGSVLSLSNDDFLYEIWANPTLSAAATWNDVPDSAAQSSVGDGSITVSGGILIDSDYVAQKTTQTRTIKTARTLGQTIAGKRDELIFSVQPLTNNMNIIGSNSWSEQI